MQLESPGVRTGHNPSEHQSIDVDLSSRWPSVCGIIRARFPSSPQDWQAPGAGVPAETEHPHGCAAGNGAAIAQGAAVKTRCRDNTITGHGRAEQSRGSFEALRWREGMTNNGVAASLMTGSNGKTMWHNGAGAVSSQIGSQETPFLMAIWTNFNGSSL